MVEPIVTGRSVAYRFQIGDVVEGTVLDEKIAGTVSDITSKNGRRVLILRNQRWIYEDEAKARGSVAMRYELLALLIDARNRLKEFIGAPCECDNTHGAAVTRCCLCEYADAIRRARERIS